MKRLNKLDLLNLLAATFKVNAAEWCSRVDYVENKTGKNNMSRKWPMAVIKIFLAPALIAVSNPLMAQHTRSHSSEQLTFSAEEDGVKKPASIPPDVMELLKKDDLVRHQLEYDDVPGETASPSWFSASVVHLHGSAPKRSSSHGNGAAYRRECGFVLDFPRNFPWI